MKKVLFLMILLFLMGLGTASVKAQVRIGGNTPPSAAAVLDLNVDNTNVGNKGALALPRVALTSTTMQLNGAAPINGMLVYNTGGSLSAGIYFYDGTNWMPVSGDGVIGNEFSDTIPGGGLTKSGSGTASDPLKVGINTKHTDSLRFLMSTGSGVYWQQLFHRNVMGLSSSMTGLYATTWSRYYVTVTIPATHEFTYLVFTVPGAQTGDLCTDIDKLGNILIHATNGGIYVLTMGIFDNAISGNIVCYRPA